jgi:hypothetical protein
MSEDALYVVHEQAADDGLWFIAATAPEAYLQAALRRLHAAVEAAPAPQEGALPDGWLAEAAFPKRDPTRTAEQQGLFQKFDVRRTDGSSEPGGKHHGCRYFVLDMNHDPHAGLALMAYAASCKDTHPQLSADLLAHLRLAEGK